MNESPTPPSIREFLVRSVSRRGPERALGFIRNGALHWRTWQQLSDDATHLAAALRAAGISPGDCVAHVSENRHEWVITDLALHLAGGVHVPIHVTLSGEQIAEQITDSGSRLVFVSTQDLLAKFADRLPPQTTVIVHDELQGFTFDPIRQPPALPGVKFQSQPDDQKPPAKPGAICQVPSLEPLAPSPTPNSLATILYTSGTTGRPRGVMLSHHNLASNAAATADSFGDMPQETRLCVLPLSHIYARTCDLYTWVYRGSRLVLGESRDTLAHDLQLVQPTALNAVPFLYQRIADRIRAAGGDTDAALRAFFGPQMDLLNCGGAPLAPDIEAWYAAHNMPVLIGYGLTETSPVIAASTPQAHRAGAVGRLLPEVEVKIAADGEILSRGPNTMLGYWHDAAATAEVIRDGWFHTGDLGAIDDDGFLSIRGRKKELIVLSTGKKVAPSRVELLLTASPLIEQAAVFGDGQCGLIALIVPAACGSASPSPTAATNATYEQEIARCLAAAAHEEQVHRFHLLDRPFSIERGEMTGKLSLRRAVIARNFAAELRQLETPSSQANLTRSNSIEPAV